jgi:hypothetical protein
VDKDKLAFLALPGGFLGGLFLWFGHAKGWF